MKRGLILVLAVCTFAAAMVPRDRRSVSNEKKQTAICSEHTPCAWVVHNPTAPDFIDKPITNSYCQCGVGTVCRLKEKDEAAGAYVHRCQAPSEDPKKTTKT